MPKRPESHSPSVSCQETERAVFQSDSQGCEDSAQILSVTQSHEIEEADADFVIPDERLARDSTHHDKFSAEGFRDWKTALETGKAFDRHNASQLHKDNFQKWQMYLINDPVDAQLSVQRANQIELKTKERQNRFQAVFRLADIASTLARLRLPFRGHDESETSKNKGVFREVTRLVARYDDVLHAHIELAKKNPKGVPSYLSAQSQNEMIGCIAKEVRGKIKDEVKETKLFSVCLDTTPDSAKQDQLSVILHFVDKTANIQECLIDMVNVKDTTGIGLARTLVETMEKYNLEVSNIRGQGYDGCAAMSGIYRGVQAIIKQTNDKAYFVHCYAHRMNLVVVDMCCKNIPSRNFFGLIEQLYVFMEGSTKRHSLFIDVQKELMGNDPGRPKTLKSLSTTRWASRIDNCRALLITIDSVVETLDRIQTSVAFDRDTSGTAMALRRAIDFEFCFHLVALSRILSVTGTLSKYLQDEDMDICTAIDLVNDCKMELSVLRGDEVFNEMWNEAEMVASKIDVEWVERRQRKVSRRLDDNWQSQTQISQKEEVKVNFYFATLDLCIQSITERFSIESQPLLKHTDCLTRPSLEKIPNLKQLCAYYEGDVNSNQAEIEYKLLIHRLNRENTPPCKMLAIYQFLLQNGLVEAYPEISKMYQLIITLPVTSCSNERCFSALKFIKNRLRTTMLQERMADLMVIAVEAERTQDVNLERVRDSFWSLADRR
ncbi:unnamed protein product [Leuciscus chuanchicus]